MNGLLLDTHVALWLLNDDPRLGEAARQSVLHAPVVRLSAASRWELRIKATLGKVVIPDDFVAGCAAAGLKDLPVTGTHADLVDMTALAHRDPFDALLVAQATAEGLLFLTADRKILSADVGAVDARI